MKIKMQTAGIAKHAEWNCPLNEAYPVLCTNAEGRKDALTISVGDNESLKYWLSVLNEQKNRGGGEYPKVCVNLQTDVR